MTFVAITATSTPAGRRGLDTVALASNYLLPLIERGLVPLILTPSHSGAAREAILRVSRGLILTGGEDVNPARYGAQAAPQTEAPNDARDELELDVCLRMLELDRPLMAICRGVQILAVARGGSLVQDIPSLFAAPLEHSPADASIPVHSLSIEPGSRLQVMAGRESPSVNSSHHQAVDAPGDGMIVVARTRDGVVEAIEDPVHQWVVGVQWHPERAPLDPINRALYDDFAAAVRGGLGRS